MLLKLSATSGSHTNLLRYIRPLGLDIYIQLDIWTERFHKRLPVRQKLELIKNNIFKSYTYEDARTYVLSLLFFFRRISDNFVPYRQMVMTGKMDSWSRMADP